MKILIIDDEKPVRDCIHLLVNWTDFNIDTVYEAEDGHEAIRMISEQQPDIIITDIRMPITDGLQLMDWIHHNHPKSQVIAVSGFTDYEYVRQFFIQGGIDYINKPIQPQKLHDALRKTLSTIERNKLNTTIQPIASISDDENIYYQIKYYIDEYYYKELSLNTIANHFHLSEAYLSRKFKQLFQTNIVQYIKSVRTNHAKKLLLSTPKKVSEIACLVGYNDEKYFSRVFKEFENMSPNEYRQKHK